MFFVYRYPQGKKSSLKSHVLMFFCLKKSCRSSGFEQTKHLLDLQNLHEPKKSSLKSHVLLFFCRIIRGICELSLENLQTCLEKCNFAAQTRHEKCSFSRKTRMEKCY